MRPWLNQGDKGRQCSVEHNLEYTFFVCGHKAILKFISREASWAVEDQGQDCNNYDWRTGMYLITFMSFNFKSNSSVHWNQITMQSIQDDDKTISTQLKDIWRETREWRKYWKTTRTCVRTAAAAHTCVLSTCRRWFPTGSMKYVPSHLRRTLTRSPLLYILSSVVRFLIPPLWDPVTWF